MIDGQNAASFLLWRCTLVDEIDDAYVGNAGVGFKSYLAGTAVRVAHLDVVLLYLRAQLTESVHV